ncbi:hypothetical protein H4217_001987 [Coemansia sp. RSA 1939]|nr:hypothetical protein H4217_001987 [Coemansia sp. RSA 1939]KAJ2601862.1 hypothetical protein EV177_006910 [Coemansia sp. RSA 1804]KAJ2682897.1 hypothetical protein GGH99_004558 [Coemansia sp. RSA 1285]
MEPDKKRHRAATVILYPANSLTSLSISPPLSDIGDWRDAGAIGAETRGTWQGGHTLRRVRSWVTSTPSRHLPALSTWLGDLGSYVVPPSIGLRWPAQRRQSAEDCFRRRSCDCHTHTRLFCRCCRCSHICNTSSGGEKADCAVNCFDVACEDKPQSGTKSPICQEPACSGLEIHSDDSSTIGDSQKDSKQTHAYIVDTQTDTSRRPLMSVFQIPEYMVEDYIWDAYRPLSFSYCECLKSWGYVHSELGNIMTHLVGLVVFLVLALVTGPVIIPSAVGRLLPDNTHVAPEAADYLVVYTYIFTVLFCLAASVAFHTLSCHSQRKHFRALRCDFIGILTLIVGSFVPVGYYGFVHSRGILIGYMVMFVAVGVLGVAASVFGRAESPQRAFLRPVIFMAIAASGLVPLVHGAVLSGYSGAVSRLSLWYVVAMGMVYVTGTLIYAFKIPERYRPGKHNVLLHSHQIFHVLVVVAAVCHYVGIIRALEWVHVSPDKP